MVVRLSALAVTDYEQAAPTPATMPATSKQPPMASITVPVESFGPVPPKTITWELVDSHIGIVATSAIPNGCNITGDILPQPTELTTTFPTSFPASSYFSVLYTVLTPGGQYQFFAAWTYPGPPPLQCVEGDEAALIAAGWDIISGPYATEGDCNAGCH